jgi:VWFA-related protein
MMGTPAWTRRDAMAGLLGLGLSARAAAQEPDVTFSTSVDVVNVFATVRDGKGRYVSDLAQTDFELKEDGRVQQIRYFSRQTDVPLTIGMLVDTSQSMRMVLDTERVAGKAFFAQVLRPEQDLAFVIGFDVFVELRQDLTRSLADLNRALDALDVPGRGGGAPGAGIGTALYDAVFLAASEVLRRQDGRKTMLLLSDGEDFGSQVTFSRAIEAAQRADVSVYAIRISDPGGPGFGGGGFGRGGFGRGGAGLGLGRRDGREVLRDIAEQTGGRYFEVLEARGLANVYRQIEEELRNQYNLGYVSTNAKRDGAFRKIEVKARPRGLSVQARKGYYAPK